MLPFRGDEAREDENELRELELLRLSLAPSSMGEKVWGGDGVVEPVCELYSDPDPSVLLGFCPWKVA